MMLEATTGHEQKIGTLQYSVSPLCMFLMESAWSLLVFCYFSPFPMECQRRSTFQAGKKEGIWLSRQQVSLNP